jgi:thiamine transport system ATP-binding protein
VSAGLAVHGVTVSIEGTTIIDRVELAVDEGDIVALLGPSGCGKTTLLRAIAGLQPTAAGTVEWAGSDLRRIPPHQRGFGLMFQDHALFPHLSVAENVAYGLKVAGAARAARAERVATLLDLVGLGGFGGRDVQSLSGGEAQRVALARALAPAPRLLMLDEPLGSLDLDLRRRLSGEIRLLLKQLGVTAVHVTHDQDEAFDVADRIAIMQRGTIVRIDRPEALWHDPQTALVARFVGHRNIVTLPDRGHLVVRPDAISLIPRDAAIELDAAVIEQRFRAGRYLITASTAWGELQFATDERAPDGRTSLFIDPQRLAPLRAEA